MRGLTGIFDGRSGREDRGACDVAEGEKSGRRLRYRKAEWGAAAGH